MLIIYTCIHTLYIWKLTPLFCLGSYFDHPILYLLCLTQNVCIYAPFTYCSMFFFLSSQFLVVNLTSGMLLDSGDIVSLLDSNGVSVDNFSFTQPSTPYRGMAPTTYFLHRIDQRQSSRCVYRVKLWRVFFFDCPSISGLSFGRYPDGQDWPSPLRVNIASRGTPNFPPPTEPPGSTLPEPNTLMQTASDDLRIASWNIQQLGTYNTHTRAKRIQVAVLVITLIIASYSWKANCFHLVRSHKHRRLC